MGEKTDWNEVRRRMEAVNKIIERGFSQGPDEARKILRQRARLLAREEAKKEEKYMEILEFLLSYENYGIEPCLVREVYPLKEYTPVPCTPPFVLGLINVRGQIIPVIDIKKFFELPEKGLGDLNRVIIVHDDTMEFGIVADTVLGVRQVRLKDIQPSLPTLTGIREKYLRGVTKEGVVILDAKKLLEDPGVVIHEEVIIGGQK